MKMILVLCAVLAFAVRTSSQTPPVQLAIDPVSQKDAPVQIVGIEGSGDNALYAVTIKNGTDKYIQDFYITWTVFRPVNCAATGPACACPRIQHMSRTSQSAHAVDRSLLRPLSIGFSIRIWAWVEVPASSSRTNRRKLHRGFPARRCLKWPRNIMPRRCGCRWASLT